MRKAVFLCICLIALLAGVAVVVTFSFAASRAKIQANGVELTSQDGIIWNNTDCNVTIAQNTYSGLQNISARTILEYADAASQFDVQFPNGLNQKLMPRIIIEYADYASYMAFPLQQYPGPMPFPHDVAVTDVSSLGKTVVGQNYTCSMNVNVSNECDFNETFCVEVYANATMMGTQDVYDLLNGTFTTTTLTWNSTGFAYGNYTLSAWARFPGETNTVDNNYTDGTPIHVGVPGDVSSKVNGTYDGIVNMRDIAYMVALFNTKPGSPSWNPNADVNDDGVCNMRDIAIALYYFNQHE